MACACNHGAEEFILNLGAEAHAAVAVVRWNFHGTCENRWRLNAGG